jgi:photosystem I subunit V
MAACAATSRVTTGIPSLSGSNKVVARGAAAVQASFAGLRSGNTRVDGLSLSRSRSFANRTAVAKSVANTTCGLDTPVVISLSTGALLFLGRFVFLPFQRDNVSGFSRQSRNSLCSSENFPSLLLFTTRPLASS